MSVVSISLQFRTKPGVSLGRKPDLSHSLFLSLLFNAVFGIACVEHLKFFMLLILHM